MGSPTRPATEGENNANPAVTQCLSALREHHFGFEHLPLALQDSLVLHPLSQSRQQPLVIDPVE